MPLASGKSRKTISANIRELHSGPTYAHTAKKFGAKRAQAQSVAIALSKARERVPKRMRGSGAISDTALNKSK